MICLILKQKTSWCVNPICQSAKSTNEQNKCFKKILLLLYFLEEAADFGCRISLSNGHSSWCVFLTESVDKLVKRLSHFKTIPKSSSNCFVFVSFVLFCFFKLQTKARSPASSSKNSLVTRLLSVCGTPAVLWTQSLQLQCPLFRK